MRRWNTLSSVYDTEYRDQPRQDIVLSDKTQDIVEGQRGVFLTEGVEMDRMVVHTTPRGRSPSPGSRTCIPNDIMEQFQGDIYGRMKAKAGKIDDKLTSKALSTVSTGIEYSEQLQGDMFGRKNITATDDMLTSKALSNVGTGIVPAGWRPPRSRTPILLAETPSRYAPKPLRQPPAEAIPKSLHIVSIRKPRELVRCKSTPPRTSTPDHDLLPQVLSDTSLPTNSIVSMEVRGPSSTVTGDMGAIPPPPSPEATVTLKNELQLTLETLCEEEDERSSRNTSIVDIVEKDVTLSRLSPLGGGSEMSDESVELPSELHDNEEDEHTIQQPTQETTEQQVNDENNLQHTLEGTEKTQSKTSEEYSTQETTESKEQQLIVNNELHKGETSIENQSETKIDSSENKPTEIGEQTETTDNIQDKASDLEQLEKLTEGLLLMGNDPADQEDTGASKPPRGTPEPTEKTEERPDHPPGSPDITPTQDFTEGLDMGLDLAAELQAAMEGLDDFNLDDDEGDDDNDENPEEL